MKHFSLVFAACWVTTATFAQNLSWSDFAARPEIWPAQCTLKRTMKFSQGPVAAGQKLDVIAVRANQIELATAKGLAFAAEPEDTDALILGAELWKKLSPQQRELTYATLLKRKDLWPYRVKLTQPVDLGNQKIARGETVVISGLEGDRLLVVSEKANTLFDVAPRDTELLAYAWKALALPTPSPGRFSEELQGKLVNATTGSAVSIEPAAEPRYYAFYRGASWCGPCRQFSPSLVKFYTRVKPAHPEFELVLVSDDKKAADMYSYSKEEGFAWPAVPATRYPELRIINPLFGNTIPQLVMTDRYGNVLVDSNQVGREPALKQIEALLNKPEQGTSKSL